LTAELTSGCTATIYSPGGCMVTAGHCQEPAQPVVQFNVPPSLANGALQHPPPEDQYTVDSVTLLYSNGGLGNDWAVFQCLPNTQTGLNVYEAQGVFVPFAAQVPTLPANLTLYGYGADDGVDNQVQQFSAGPISSYGTSLIRHRADTTGGNSGSALLNAAGQIIGVHTNAGCNGGTGVNLGTSIANAQFAAAVDFAVVELSLPDGEVKFIHPLLGATLQVEVSEGCETAEIVELMVQVDGGGFQNVPMTEQAGGAYEVAFPAAKCGSQIEYYVLVTSSDGGTVTQPPDAPGSVFHASVTTASTTVVSLDFETSDGWTVSGDASVGAWEAGVPVNDNRGDPPADADGSGQCFVTANFAGDSDVDSGSTVLTSPGYDLSSLDDPYVRYARWYHNSFGSAPFEDTFVVEVSNDDGAAWSPIETVGPAGLEVSGGWIAKSFRITDVVAPTATMRFRFTASDVGDGSVVEAGVDSFEIFDAECFEVVCGDLDIDGDVDLVDFAVFGQCFAGAQNPPNPNCPVGVDADCDDDGDVDLSDFASLSQNFTGSM
jgi:V8-like Glu-specific endopeptidase